MPKPDLTTRVLERFAAIAKATDKADANVVAVITAKVTADPEMGRVKLLAVAKQAVEGAHGAVD